MALQRQLKVVEGLLATPEAQPMLKVAFATGDLKHVDQHFGSAERFAIYAVEADSANLLEVAEFGRLARDGNEGKLLEKFVVLDGCAAVYCLAVGASAVRQLVGLDIQPFKVAEGTPVSRLLGDLQKQMRAGSDGWVVRALERRRGRRPDRFDQMESEGWDE